MTTDSTRASLELLYSISRELTAALDLHTVLERILTLSTSNVNAERGSVIVFDDHLLPVDAAMVYEGRLIHYPLDSMQSTLDQGLAGWVMRSLQSTLVTDTSQDPRWQRRPDDDTQRTGAKSAICAPILVRGHLVGVLTLVHGSPNAFLEEHLTLLQAIADQAGVAVYNARLFSSLVIVRQNYQELFEDSIDPILITRLDGKIKEANRQAAIVSLRPLSGLKEMSFWKYHTPPNEALEAQINSIQPGETLHYEGQFTPPENKPLPVEIYVRKVSFDGEDLLQWIVRDISERKQLDTLRDDLSAMIYHDLRAPLGNIVSSLDMLRTFVLPQNSDENEMTHQLLAIATRSTDRMQRLISSLLDINRLEAGQPIMQRKNVAMLPMLRDALDNLQAVTQARRQKLQLDAPDSLPEAWIDEDMIRRVVINLLDNATKFTPAEGLITLGAHQEGSLLRIWVEDDGPGIPEEGRELIFNKFARLDIEHFPKGMGLGLAFCRLAVRAHGGTIGVENQPGSGSRFSFTLPLTEASAKAAA